MRVVDQLEFLCLPNGTVFQFIAREGYPEPGLFARNSVVAGEGGHADFYYTPMFIDSQEAAERSVFAPTCVRTSTLDEPDQRYLVLEPQDMRDLMNLLGLTVVATTILAGPGDPN